MKHRFEGLFFKIKERENMTYSWLIWNLFLTSNLTTHFIQKYCANIVKFKSSLKKLLQKMIFCTKFLIRQVVKLDVRKVKHLIICDGLSMKVYATGQILIHFCCYCGKLRKIKKKSLHNPLKYTWWITSPLNYKTGFYPWIF